MLLPTILIKVNNSFEMFPQEQINRIYFYMQNSEARIQVDNYCPISLVVTIVATALISNFFP